MTAPLSGWQFTRDTYRTRLRGRGEAAGAPLVRFARLQLLSAFHAGGSPALRLNARNSVTAQVVATAFEGRDYGDSALMRSFSQHPSLRRTLFALCDQRGSANYSRVLQVAFPPSCGA
jgi:hypothetical protein